jgi:hypothetical protein
MYAKIINPKTNGRKVYNNAGSSLRCANYLSKEAKEAGGEATFFGSPGAPERTAAEAVALLDGNVKGLKKDDPKFHSLVLSPSIDELIHIGNDKKALEKYTQNVMDLYAKNFQLKEGRQLGEKDLIWVATIHQERKNRGTDEGPAGEKKDGLQTHIHIMVSARDAAQKITLNPLGRAERFNRVQFQAEANTQIEVQFGRVTGHDITRPLPGRRQMVREKAEEITTKAAANRQGRKPLTPEQMAAKDARLDVQVARVNTKLSDGFKLDPEKVKEAARVRNYDNVFYNRLGRIERNAEKGKITPGPHEYLRTGRVTQLAEVGDVIESDQKQTAGNYAPAYEQPVVLERGWVVAAQRSISQLSQAMTLSSRTQDVRSDSEKAQEPEF